MNDLSWMLYLADVLPNFSKFTAWMGFVLFISLGIVSAIGFTRFLGDADAVYDYDYDKASGKTGKAGDLKNPELKALADSFSKCLWPASISLVIWGGSFLVPEKETFYLIAASEAGEKVVTSPTAEKALKVIDKWLEEKLK